MNREGQGTRPGRGDLDATSETLSPSLDLDAPYAGPGLQLEAIRVLPVLRPAERGLDLEQRLQAREQELAAALAEVAESRQGREALMAENCALADRCRLLEQALGEALERVAAAEAAAADHSPTVRLLREELRGQRQRVAELEADLRAAESQVHRLEALLRQPAAHRIHDGASGDAATAESAEPAMRNAPGAEVPTRYLLLLEGDTETLFPLRMRTSIGREPDNDIQIDSRFISRHHAVVHVGVHHTVVEDLGSTNGVLVNGQRVQRRALSEGDLLTIGKSQFRFLERSPRPEFI
jgi:hypothetical protein